jgi:hypothetical protein
MFKVKNLTPVSNEDVEIIIANFTEKNLVDYRDYLYFTLKKIGNCELDIESVYTVYEHYIDYTKSFGMTPYTCASNMYFVIDKIQGIIEPIHVKDIVKFIRKEKIKSVLDE